MVTVALLNSAIRSIYMRMRVDINNKNKNNKNNKNKNNKNKTIKTKQKKTKKVMPPYYKKNMPGPKSGIIKLQRDFFC